MTPQQAYTGTRESDKGGLGVKLLPRGSEVLNERRSRRRARLKRKEPGAGGKRRGMEANATIEKKDFCFGTEGRERKKEE